MCGASGKGDEARGNNEGARAKQSEIVQVCASIQWFACHAPSGLGLGVWGLWFRSSGISGFMGSLLRSKTSFSNQFIAAKGLPSPACVQP